MLTITRKTVAFISDEYISRSSIRRLLQLTLLSRYSLNKSSQYQAVNHFEKDIHGIHSKTYINAINVTYPNIQSVDQITSPKTCSTEAVLIYPSFGLRSQILNRLGCTFVKQYSGWDKHQGCETTSGVWRKKVFRSLRTLSRSLSPKPRHSARSP